MSINLISLNNAFKSIEPPTRVDEIRSLRLRSRVAILNEGLVFHNPKAAPISEGEMFTEVTLIAVKYCRNRNDCWLEWELML